MNLQIDKSLATFEEKVSIDLITKKYKKQKYPSLEKIPLNNHIIWKIDHFLVDEECDEMIQSCETVGFKKLENYDTHYRDSERLLVFDNNQQLMNTINKRLNKHVLSKLNKEKIKPYGFFTNHYEWSDINGVNQCLRISKYNNSNGFNYHRDAQYTANDTRSVYSLVIYLSNTEGDIAFVTTTNSHDGKTIDEEIKYMDKSITIKPKKGTALIFDQRLIHKAHPCTEKYVLRTDLLVSGQKQSHIENIEEKKIMTLTQKLFRQAQYYDLNHDNKAKELYEICISLRQEPSKIKYPSHLKKLLTPIPLNIPINTTYNLQLVSRNGEEYLYSYDNIDTKADMYNALRICVIFLVNSFTSDLTGLSSNYLDKIPDYIGNIKVNEPLDDYLEDKLKDNIKDDFETYFKHKHKKTPEKYIKYNDDELVNSEFWEYINEKYNLNENTDNLIPNSIGHMITDYKEYTAMFRCKCGLGDSDDDEEDVATYSYITNERFEMNDSIGILFNPIFSDKESMYGNVYITANEDEFNHASCNCSRYLVHDGTTENKYPISLNITYNVIYEDKLIQLEYIPNVTI